MGHQFPEQETSEIILNVNSHYQTSGTMTVPLAKMMLTYPNHLEMSNMYFAFTSARVQEYSARSDPAEASVLENCPQIASSRGT